MAKGKYQKWLEPEGLTLIEGWARNGLTEEQIAKNIGVSYSTFKEWKTKYPAISAPLKRGKDVIDTQVENTLLKSAMGHTVKETTYEYDGDGILVSKIVKEKEVPPNTTAIIFWLKNRKASEWREKQTVAVEASADEAVKEMEEYFANKKRNT